MARIKAKNTKPEKRVRQWLWSNGYRYYLHKKDLPGKPDIVFPGMRKAVFVNGCFWHMHDCADFNMPATNIEFWKKKLESNQLRDIRNYEALFLLGWNYYIIWECDLKRDLEGTMNALDSFLEVPSRGESGKNVD